MRRFRDVLAVVVLVLALSLSACGDSSDTDAGNGDAQQSSQSGNGDDGGSGSGGTQPVKQLTPAERKQEAQEHKQVLRTSSGVYAAIADRDGKALCKLLTEESKQKIETELGESCAAYYSKLMNPIASKGTRDRSAARAKISGIDVNGDEAIATVTFDRKNAGVIELVRADDRWVVASFTVPRTIAGTR